MANARGFLDFKRKNDKKSPPLERVKNFKEFIQPLDKKEREIQASRCMDCGVAFCHTGRVSGGRDIGCPLHNLIPEFNDALYRGNWHEAFARLDLTNPFPEFTGRVCPAPCEDSCVCAINTDSVSIKANELAIAENAFKEGLILPQKPTKYNGKKIAIIGSGPAGLACAHSLNLLGYKVCVYEKSDRVGGLLMYGIPDMKLEKSVVERRVDLLKKSGIEFKVKQNIDSKKKVASLLKDHDALVLCTGAGAAMDLDLKGRGLKGVELALDFLTQNTKALLNTGVAASSARGKNVLVIGSGDTSVDCVAVATRQGAKSITRFERSPKKSEVRSANNPWPLKADVFTTDYGLEEALAAYGKDVREYQKMTKEFCGKDRVEGVLACDLRREDGKNIEVSGSEKFYAADLVLLAIGFSGSEKSVAKNFGVDFDAKNNVETQNYKTKHEKIFACGDARMGQSLVVWAIRDGLLCARAVDESLDEA
ncbi:glutamate synthase subunit beta [Campylobacter sp.]|uniref:glutamate synthase subunit beta n=1 Tax=Campylobacter sp. TaxID=205 RepID=UPI0026DBF3E6|nr:glutamate synthase subunit beta [Campylobacter sp.]MDO4674574.1 glutamate synthase subunit beta [Campylobacter sp.]